ncbi:MAG: hypothetical protein R2755_18590 [Acidimicrobiales bacterium]
MHLLAVDLLAHRSRGRAGDAGRAAEAGQALAALQRLTGRRLLVAAAISEHEQDLLRPRTGRCATTMGG